MKNISIPKITLNNVKIWLESIDRPTLIRNAVLGASLLAFAMFICLPMAIQAKKLSKEGESLRSKINLANVKISRIPEMLKQKEQYGARIKKIREEFFETQQTDKLIEIVSKAAVDSGVKISASKPSAEIIEIPPPFDKSYTPVSYDLSIQGGYHAIGKFVNFFEQYPKSFAVHNLTISHGPSDSLLREATLTLTAFIKHANT